MSLSSKRLSAPPSVAVRAAIALRTKLKRAADAVVPARVAVLERVVGAAEASVLGALADAGVPDLLERGPLDAAALAAQTKTDPDAMARVMRAAVYMGFFARRADGRYANNRMSRALLDRDDSSRAFAVYFSSRSNLRAWADFRETLRTGENAFERVHGKSVWAWFDEHPDERETFARAMMSLTIMEAAGVAETYPFGEIGKVCDVGGGRGTLLSEILLHHPRLEGDLVDAPGVLASAKQLLAARGVADRVTLVPGSFFESVPPGADAYLLKNILHDWDDARSRIILEKCRAAMTSGKRVVVIEQIVEPDDRHPGTMVDLQMMAVCSGGRERGRKDFDRLLTDSGFRLGRVLVTSTTTGVIEGIAV